MSQCFKGSPETYRGDAGLSCIVTSVGTEGIMGYFRIKANSSKSLETCLNEFVIFRKKPSWGESPGLYSMTVVTIFLGLCKIKSRFDIRI